MFVLFMYVSGSERVSMWLWLFAHMCCGCGFVSAPRAFLMSCMGVPSPAPACTRLCTCAHPCPGDRCSLVHSYADKICRVLTLPFVKSATCPLDSEQILLLTCVSPQVYTSSPMSPRAHLKRTMLVLFPKEVGERRRFGSQEVSGGEGP